MSQSRLLTESQTDLSDILLEIKESYFLKDSNGNIFGHKSIDFSEQHNTESSNFIFEAKLADKNFTNFLHLYTEFYNIFGDKNHEVVNQEDRNNSEYRFAWALISEFFEDVVRKYERTFHVAELFGVYERYDLCNTTDALHFVQQASHENNKVTFLWNLGDKPLVNCFPNQPSISLEPSSLYLFPCCFSHKLSFKKSEECLVLMGGAA